MKLYSFYLVSHKYPVYIGQAAGKDKKQALEALKAERGYSNTLKIGRKVKGYIVKV